MITSVEKVSKEFGLYQNKSNIKLMILNGRQEASNVCNIPNIDIVEQVTYLGAIMTNEGGYFEEIRHRIALA